MPNAVLIAKWLPVFVLGSLFCSQYASAQTGDISSPYPSNFFVERITERDGLSSNAIECVYRDRRGFLWIGTDNGLNEFDGRSVTVFRHNRVDSSSIANNHVWSIIEDESGCLWLGTDGGVCRFNPFDHKSVSYNRPEKSGAAFDSHLNFNCHLFKDQEGNLFACTAGGLRWFDARAGKFMLIRDGALDGQYVHCMAEDTTGVYWIGTSNGLIRWERMTGSTQRYPLGDGKGENLVTTVFRDHLGRILVGSWGKGLCIWDPVHARIDNYAWNYKVSETVNRVVMAINESLEPDGKCLLWVGTSEGLFRLALPDKPYPSMLAGLMPLPGVQNPGALTYDREGILWIGDKGGLCKYVRRNQYFLDVASPKGFPSRLVVDTFGGHRSLLLASWYGNGLVKYDDHFNVHKAWPSLPPRGGTIDNAQVSDVVRSRSGFLWVATFNGLCKIDESNNTYIWYRHRKNDPASLGDSRLTAVAEDTAGKIWIGTYNSGVDRFDPSTGVFTHFVHDENVVRTISTNRVWSFHRDPSGTMWVCTNDAICRFVPSSSSFITYRPPSGKGEFDVGAIVNNAVSDRSGMLWLSTSKGLTSLDPSSGAMHVYASEEGMGDDNVRYVMNDADGRIWLSTEKGLSRFDPLKRVFVNFGERNGIPVLMESAMARDWDGNMLVGGPDRLIRFSPQALAGPSVPPPVYVTGIRVEGKLINFTRPLEEVGRLDAKYPDNTISFTFSAPEFYDAGAVRYSYRLDGVDNTWSRPDQNTTVHYGGLSPGTYRFRVRAIGSDGASNEAGTSFLVTIKPAYWQTTWFKVLLACIFLLSVYGLFWSRIRSIGRREALKTTLNRQLSDMRLKVLRTQMNPHFLFNALNSIQECIYTGQTEAASRYLSRFSRLVRLILEQSEHTFVTVGSEKALLELYLEVECLRFQDSLTYSITLEHPDSAYDLIPPMIVQPFVENALWHGLARKEGEKELSVHFSGDDRFVHISVRDNGIGREAAGNAGINHVPFKEARTSMGMRLTEEQLHAIRQLSGEKADVVVEDLRDAEGKASGTLVLVRIPRTNLPSYQTAAGLGKIYSGG